MRFHAAFRATHAPGGFGHVQFLPVTHDEGFALTLRQARDLFVNDFKDLGAL
jgi:hypothetical protein